VLCRRLPCNLLPPFCTSDTPPSAEQKNAIAVAHVKAGKGLLKVRPPLTALDMLVLRHVFCATPPAQHGWPTRCRCVALEARGRTRNAWPEHAVNADAT
jgi:hypothetical protein